MGSITIQFTDEADRAVFVDLLAEAIGKALAGRETTCQLEVVQQRAEAMEGASPPRMKPSWSMRQGWQRYWACPQGWSGGCETRAGCHGQCR